MMSCVRMYLRAAISFRACPAVLGVLKQSLSGVNRIPAASTVQSWVLRIGVHELIRTRQQSDDWVVMADHTCQLGHQKCLLLLGIRLSHWRTLNRPLQFQDMTMLTTEVVPGSNGEIVQQQLIDVQGKVGQLAGVISDQGADLVKGIGLLVADQRRSAPVETPTKVFKDFSHASSHLFKTQLLADTRWTEFLNLCGKTQPRIKQTSLGALAPPSQKAKGRYMNIGEIIRWGEKMMPHLVGEGGRLPEGLTADQIRQHFGWLVPFRRSLRVWGQLNEIRKRSLVYLRSFGYHATAADEVKSRLSCLRTTDSTRMMIDQIVALVREQSAGLQMGESYPASTEILESLIGKGKQMQFQNSRQGFTKMVAAMSAVVARIDEPFVARALETVGEQDLRNWARKAIGHTIAGIRRAVLGGTKPT
jgi:hypothetical protein